jgi:hypothetical protein
MPAFLVFRPFKRIVVGKGPRQLEAPFAVCAVILARFDTERFAGPLERVRFDAGLFRSLVDVVHKLWAGVQLGAEEFASLFEGAGFFVATASALLQQLIGRYEHRIALSPRLQRWIRGSLVERPGFRGSA